MSGPASDRGGRIDPVALEVDVVAEAVAVLVHRVQANAGAAPQRLVDIAGEAEAAKAVARGGQLRGRR